MKQKLFKKLSRKISVLTVAMLILQPLVMLGMTPANTFAAVSETADHIVISEVQVSGATSNDEFIELYNPTAVSVDLSSYSIQYKGGASGTFSKKNFVSGDVIPSSGFFLIAHNDYTGVVVPDMNHGSFTISTTGGTVFLANDQVLLTTGEGVSIIDKVAYGSGTLYPETTATVAPLANQSIERKSSTENGLGNALDTDNNASDFGSKVTPDPQNSSSPIEDIIAPVVTVNTLETDNTTPKLTGTIDDENATLEITVDGKKYDGTNNEDGTWEADVTNPLDEDTYDVKAEATDTSENVGTDTTTDELSIVGDTFAPIVTVDALATKNQTPLLSGTVNDNDASIKVTVNENTYDAINNEDGTWSASVTDELPEGTYNVSVEATDESDNVGNDVTSDELTIDLTVPTLTSTVTPVIANQNDKKVEIEITADEALLEQKVPVAPLDQKVIALGSTYEVKLTINEDPLNPMKVYIQKDAAGDYKFEYDLPDVTEKTIEFEAEALDLAGNKGSVKGLIKIDKVAPGKVTDLTAISGNAKADLKWTNPADTDLSNIQIFRDGTLIKTLDLTENMYSDTSLINGKEYTYDVYALDISGNKSEKVTAKATPKAPALSFISTAEAAPSETSTITTEQLKPAEKGEIKADTTQKEDTKEGQGTEVKNDKKIPVWGIIFLLILAAIGGYLFYVQNPGKFTGPKGKK